MGVGGFMIECVCFYDRLIDCYCMWYVFVPGVVYVIIEPPHKGSSKPTRDLST